MEILYILLVIVVIIMIVSLRGRLLGRMDLIEEEILRLRKDLLEKAAQPTHGNTSPPPVQTPVPSPEQRTGPQAPKETEPYTPPASITRPHDFRRPAQPEAVSTPTGESGVPTWQPSPGETTPAVPQPLPGGSASAPLEPPHGPGQRSPLTPPHGPSQRPPQAPPPPPQPGFFERHPDLEKFIGENLISKIGIAILVLGIGFFVKYAIDNGWIPPIGRICIGLLCGGILVGIAHFLRKSYKAFSSVLVGGGLAVFYFTIALAFHQFHLLGQTAAFIIMVVITAFAVVLSLLYDRQELAIIALVGGFITPFLASNGSGNYKILFSYLLILNTGLLVIAYRKYWRLLNILAFAFTVILYGSWLVTLPYDEPAQTFRGGFLFATIFYILFFVVNILYNVRENRKFIASDFGILLANTCLYFGVSLYLLTAMDMQIYRGLFSACMGIFNLAISYFLFRRKKVDANILYLLIGITLTFISLTAPIQLHGHYITLFWASESVLLYWLAQKSGLRIIGISSRIIWSAMLLSLLMDWENVYGHDQALNIVFNKGLITTIYVSLSCLVLYYLLPAGWLRNIVSVTGSTLLLMGGMLEIHHQFTYHYPASDIYALYMAIYGYGWIILSVYGAARWKWYETVQYTSWLLVAGIAIYLLMTVNVYQIQTEVLPTAYRLHFLAHWVSAALVGYLIFRIIDLYRKKKFGEMVSPAAFTTGMCFVVLVFLSAEMLLVVNQLFYPAVTNFSRISDMYTRTGLPILWGMGSFVFMWLGMRHKFKPLRIVSLVIFSVTLLKLFFYDISTISVGGKIAAFICLGVLLLVVSFMYQRLKKIIIEDDKDKTV